MENGTTETTGCEPTYFYNRTVGEQNKLRAEVRDQITHGCDGPVTDFVMMARAVEMARDNPKIPTEAIYEVLHAELKARGYLVQGEDEIPGS